MSGFDFDPFSEEVLNDPFPAFAKLRATSPAYHYRKNGHDFFILSRAKDIAAAARDINVWSNRYGSIEQDLPPDMGLSSDPPQHTEFRRVLASQFTPPAVARHAKLIESFVNRLIDDMLTRTEGDFHDEFAFPLPAMVITALLDVPAEDHRIFKSWADRFLVESFNSTDPTERTRVVREMNAYSRALTRTYRDKLEAAGITEPNDVHIGSVLPDNIPARLVAARFQGRYWTQQEIDMVTTTLIAGGHETTTSLLTNLVWRLLEVPERWALLREKPELINAAIEESLRHDPPQLGMFRTSLCQTRLHELEVPEHAKLLLLFGSACRDEDVFDDAAEFRLDRPAESGRRHMAFGSGAHICPGAPLARLQVRIAMQCLLERLPDLRLLAPGKRIPVFNFWGRKKLPVAWA